MQHLCISQCSSCLQFINVKQKSRISQACVRFFNTSFNLIKLKIKGVNFYRFVFSLCNTTKTVTHLGASYQFYCERKYSINIDKVVVHIYQGNCRPVELVQLCFKSKLEFMNTYGTLLHTILSD